LILFDGMTIHPTAWRYTAQHGDQTILSKQTMRSLERM
jgi:hypothetical protein